MENRWCDMGTYFTPESYAEADVEAIMALGQDAVEASEEWPAYEAPLGNVEAPNGWSD